ncbi:MAG TPA: hypothetical protein VF862_02925 [Gemmatimonadales bacterium]
MGSIPTRSRHLFRLGLALALAAGTGPLAAQDTTSVPPVAAPLVTGTPAPQDSVVYPKPPVTPMGAFFRSLLLPGWSQSILDRRLTAGLFMAVEGLAVGMVLKSASELSYLRQYDPAKVDAKDQEREDWIAVLAFNHLFAALEGYVGAHLWDFPADVKLRAVPWRGGGIGAAVTIPLRGR